MANAKAQIDLILNSAKFKSAMSAVTRTMSKLKGHMTAVSGAAKKMLLVGGGAITGLLKIAADQQAAEQALDVALTATGQSADAWSQKMRDAASAIQDVTIYGDEMNLMLMTSLTNLGVTADKLDEATRASIGLATALGQDMKSGVRNYALALAGQTQMLGRYIPALRTATSAEEKLAIVQEFSRRGFLQAQAAVKTFSGRIKQLWNSYGDLNEVLGDVFIPDVERLIAKMKEFVPIAADWVKENKALILTYTKWTAGVLAALVLLPKVVAVIVMLIKVVVGLKIAFMGLTAVLGVSKLAMGAWVGALALGAGAIALVLIKIADLNRALEESSRESEEFARIWEEFKSRQAALKSAETEEETVLALRETIAKRKKLIEKFQADMKKYNAEPGTFDKLLGLYHEDEMNTLMQQAQRMRDKQTNALKQEEAQLDRLLEKQRERAAGGPTKYQTDSGEAIDTLTEKLKMQATTYGMTAAEAEIYKLSLRELTAEQSLQLNALREFASIEAEHTAAMRRWEDGAKSAKDKIASLTREIEILSGKDADKLELIDLENLQVAKEDIDEIREKLATRKKLQDAQAMREEVKGLKDAAKTSKERLADELKRLGELRSAGALDSGWYNRLIEDAQKRAGPTGVSNPAGGFEDLQSVYKRIQTAAAAPKDKGLQAAVQTAKSTKDTADATEKQVKTSGELLAAVKPILEPLRSFLETGVIAGAFGP